MKRGTIVLLVAIACAVALPASARVGKAYRSFRVSEFAKFFNVTTTSRVDLPDGGTLVKLEPGGYKEHIDIELTIDSAMDVVAAELRINRAWLGDAGSINPFAKDMVKSFVDQMACDADDADIKRIVEQIWQSKGSKDNVVKLESEEKKEADAMAAGPTPEFEVFMGTKEKSDRALPGCTLAFENVVGGDSTWLVVKLTRAKKK